MARRVKITKGTYQGKRGTIDGHVVGTNTFAVVVILDDGIIHYFDTSELWVYPEVDETPTY